MQGAARAQGGPNACGDVRFVLRPAGAPNDLGHVRQPMILSPPGGRPVRLRCLRPLAGHPTTFREHEGLVILVRLPKVSGALCRDCGITSFREMTSLTLIRDWWSAISPFIAPIVIALNLLRRSRVARLAPPTRASDLAAPNTKPLDPVRPVLARPSSWLGIALIAGIATFIAV